jgi:hypothetical protein
VLSSLWQSRDISVKGTSTLSRNVATFDKRLFSVYVACGLLAIFYLPYKVPLSPSVSPSYIFGYNNQAGVAFLLLFVVVGALWTKGLNLQFQAEGDSQPVPKSTLVVSLVAVLAGCAFMWVIAGWVGGFNESGYAINRVSLLAIGKMPYVDFEFAYGALFLYGPVFLEHLLRINILQAYYLFWTLNCLLGTLLLYAVVNMINYPTRRKKAIFLLLWFAGLFSSVFSMGIHGTYLRFTCPLFFVLVVDKLYHHAGSHSKIYAAALAVVFTVILLFISPETAIAHAFACACIFLLYSGGRSVGSLTLPAGLMVALAVVLWFALKLPMMDTLKAFSSGANSLPIAFAPHILLFITVLFVCTCYLVRRYLDSQLHDNTIGLIAYSFAMVFAALGRCDPYHVLLAEQGVFLASLFYASNCTVSWKWYRDAFVTIPIILAACTYFWFCLPDMARLGMSFLSQTDSNSTAGKALTSAGKVYIAAFGGDKRARWEAKFEGLRLSAATQRIDLESVYPSWHGGFLAPFGYAPTVFSTYFSERIDFGYYDGFINATTEGSVDRIIAEIHAQPQRALLVPEYFENYCKVDAPPIRRMISTLNAFPYFGKEVHEATLHQPLCDYIVENYRIEALPGEWNFGYGLWVRKSADEHPTS